MAQAQTHPLLSLSDDKIVHKLRDMNLEEILKFSLVSKKCKDLVTSIQIKGNAFHVFIGSDIAVSIATNSSFLKLHYYTEPNMYWGVGAYGRKKKLTEPQSVFVNVTTYTDDTEHTTFKLEKRHFTMKNWLEHLQIVFNYRKIDYIRFSNNSSQFDIDDVKEAFGNTTKVKMGNTGCFVFNRMLLEKFFPIENLEFKTSNFSDSRIPKKILMQNFDVLDIGDEWRETTFMSLDELLLINSKRIYIESLQMSAKELNKFIKLWQRGANPRMEWLAIKYTIDKEDDDRVIMRGIAAEIPEEYGDGIDIFRMDGVKATVRFWNSDPFPSLEMYVWFDQS